MRQFLAGSAIMALAVCSAAPALAQETTSTIRGTVTANGAPVANATVTVVNVPSGTTTTVRSNNDGSFAASGLRPGGPYTVSVSAAGFTGTQVTDISTIVAQAFELPIALQPEVAEAPTQEIVVTASRVKGAHNVSEGPATVLTAAKIAEVASVNRDIRDLMRRDPFATLDTSSTSGRNVSFAGQNPRFNRFTIDGVPITDSFGLNPDALPSRRGPVPLDSIGQFETKVAPYDIREGFFEGGVINAILKSGTNDFHGTGFYTYSSDKLTGDRTKDYITNLTGRLPEPKFNSKDYGATVSGPIVKDRLFFMVSAERVRASVPVPFGPADNNNGSPIVGLTQAQVDQISGIAQSRYGVNAGGILANNGDKDDRIVGKIDANISSTQRASITGIYTKDSINTPGTTSGTSLSTLSDDYVKPNRVIAGVAQLDSDWSSNFSTETRVLYKDYQSGQTPILANTASATVCTDAGTAAAITVGTSPTACSPNVPTVVVGPPGSAQANSLHVQTLEGSIVARLTAGDHHIRTLVDIQNSKNYDLFVNGANGTYYFDSIAAFNAGTAQSFSYSNATSLNPNDAAAKFTYQTITLGAQDDWRVSSKLNFSYGLRYDLYGGESTPYLNNAFTAREGFPNTDFINGKQLLQPRVGFDYTPTRRLNIHGGGGIFGGGTPDVYVANSFSQSGVQPANITVSGNNPSILNNVNLTSVPAAANALLQNATISSLGSVSALAPNFKIPSQWRTTLSVTYDTNLGPLGDHWMFGVDGFYSKVRNAIFVQDYRNHPMTGASAFTPDGRQRYFDPFATVTATGVQVDPNGDYVLGDTHHGRSYVAVARFDKKWDFGLELNGSFTWQNVKDQQALTSSIASSNYSNGAYYQANGGAFGHSNDEVKYSFKYELTYQHAFFGDYKTTFDLFGESRIGSPYSYTFQDLTSSGNNRSTVFGTVGSNSRYLFYVPTGINDPLVTYDSAATAARINDIINGSGLKKYRGKVAPRNAFNSPWFTKIDLHAEQEIPTGVFHSRISVFADVENVLNLIDHNLGQQLRSFFPYNKTVAQVACVASGANACAQYKYTSPTPDANLADQLVNTSPGASLYTVRIGARFTF